MDRYRGITARVTSILLLKLILVNVVEFFFGQRYMYLRSDHVRGPSSYWSDLPNLQDLIIVYAGHNRRFGTRRVDGFSVSTSQWLRNACLHGTLPRITLDPCSLGRTFSEASGRTAGLPYRQDQASNGRSSIQSRLIYFVISREGENFTV